MKLPTLNCETVTGWLGVLMAVAIVLFVIRIWMSACSTQSTNRSYFVPASHIEATRNAKVNSSTPTINQPPPRPSRVNSSAPNMNQPPPPPPQRPPPRPPNVNSSVPAMNKPPPSRVNSSVPMSKPMPMPNSTKPMAAPLPNAPYVSPAPNSSKHSIAEQALQNMVNFTDERLYGHPEIHDLEDVFEPHAL